MGYPQATDGDVSVTYEELIMEIWSDGHDHTETEITHLVDEIRKKIEVTQKNHTFSSPYGLGSHLVIRPSRQPSMYRSVFNTYVRMLPPNIGPIATPPYWLAL